MAEARRFRGCARKSQIRSAAGAGRTRCGSSPSALAAWLTLPLKRASAFLISRPPRLRGSSPRDAASRRGRPQSRDRQPDRVALRHQNGALDGMVQLTDVARPGVLNKRPDRGLIEAGQRSCDIAGRAARRKCAASSGMSSCRSRSGGRWISIVFSRKSRSCAKTSARRLPR